MTSLASPVFKASVSFDFKSPSKDDEQENSAPRVKKIFFDKNKTENDSNYRLRKVKDAHAVGNIAEMAAVLEKEGHKCDIIAIFGHGAPSHQGLGSSTCGDYSKGQDFCYGELEDIAKEIEVIKKYLQPQQATKLTNSPQIFSSTAMTSTQTT